MFSLKLTKCSDYVHEEIFLYSGRLSENRGRDPEKPQPEHHGALWKVNVWNLYVLKGFFCYTLNPNFYAANIWNLNAGTSTHTGLCWINSNRQFTRAQSLNRYECWKNSKSLSLFIQNLFFYDGFYEYLKNKNYFHLFYFKSLSLFLLWLLWLLKEFKITFTFFKSLKFNRWLCLLWILKEITLIILYSKSRSPF